MPVPVDGLPFDAHVNVKGAVPPVADALQVTGLPTVALPHVTVTTIGCPLILTLTVVELVAPVESVTFPVTASVPFVARVVV